MNTSPLNTLHANYKEPTVLIVDDNPINLGVIASYLEEVGFRSLVARDGEGGLKRAQYARPDIILLDVMMPGIDGFETCQKLKENDLTKDIPVIFMTALTETEAKVKGFNVGAVDYVTKPLQQEEVLARVNTHLEIRRLTQSLQGQNLRLGISNQVGQQVTAILDLNKLLVEVVNLIQNKFGYHLVEVWLYSKTDESLILQASADDQAVKPINRQSTFSINTTHNILSHVIQTGKPYLIDDIQSEETYIELFSEKETGSQLTLPLHIGDKIIGALNIRSNAVESFQSEDKTVLESLANQIAIAINNAKLYNEVTELNEHLEQKVEERTQELNTAKHNLERLNKAKTDFIQVTSHELRTPLTIIDGYTQLLKTMPEITDSSEAIELMDGVLEGTQRMLDVINVILDATKIDNNTIQLVKEEVTLHEIISKICNSFKSDLVQRELTIYYDELQTLPPFQGDIELLSKTFTHLIVNAIKYTPDGGQINLNGKTLTTDNGTPLVEIIISDTGIGIEPDHLDLIFEKFYQTADPRIHSSGKTTYKGGGPGLGLAIVKGIVKAHGGKIWAKSAAHDEETFPGSKFYMQLPL